MATTARHAYPTPASSAVPDVPVDMKALADAIDLGTPYVTTSTPGHVAGLIWYNPTTKITQISDGAAWQLVTAANWTSYTPTWVMDVPNGTKTGHYCKIGTQVSVVAEILATSGVSLGTGTITVSLPFTAATRTNRFWLGTGVFITSSHTQLAVEIPSGSSVAQVWAIDSGNHSFATPGFFGYTFVAGNRICVQFDYESST